MAILCALSNGALVLYSLAGGALFTALGQAVEARGGDDCIRTYWQGFLSRYPSP